MPRPRLRWVNWTDDRLLDTRLCDLGVRLEDTWLQLCVVDLHEDLERRGMRFRPHAWLSTDWFSPDAIPGVAIPFYLAHPRLMRLERKIMLEVEGGTREECLKILRHECGHALQHAYRLQRRRRWQQLFGPASKKYPDVYRPNPASRRFVQHLRLYYAQSHPVEDFAETFAVWMQPRALWRKRYAGWPALEKLEYVDALMAEIAPEVAPVRSRARVETLREVRRTLRDLYEEKRTHYAQGYPNIYDRELLTLFSSDPRHRTSESASRFLRRNRADIRRLVSRWTGQYQFTLDQVMSDMIGRCRELRLRAVGPEQTLRVDFAVLLTVKAMHFAHRHRSWVAL